MTAVERVRVDIGPTTGLVLMRVILAILRVVPPGVPVKVTPVWQNEDQGIEGEGPAT